MSCDLHLLQFFDGTVKVTFIWLLLSKANRGLLLIKAISHHHRIVTFYTGNFSREHENSTGVSRSSCLVLKRHILVVSVICMSNIEATRLQLDHYNYFCYIDWVLKAVKYVLGPFKRKDYFQKLQMTSLARVVYGFVRWTIRMLKLAQYLSQWYLPLCKCHICSSQCALL